MNTPRLVPYGTLQILYEEARKASSAEKGEKRRLWDRVAREYSHLYEVYGLVFGVNTDKVTVFNRQYEPFARITWDQAFTLMGDAVITSTWGNYGVGGVRGDVVWIAHCNSYEGKCAALTSWDLDLVSKIQGARGGGV